MSKYYTVQDLDTFARSVLDLAKYLGFPGRDPIKVKLLGPNEFGSSYMGTVERMTYIATASPPLPIGLEPWLWFNPVTYKFYKSGNWNSTNIWEEQTEFLGLFTENSSADNSGLIAGVAQVPIILQGEPTQPNEAATKAYVDMAIASIAAGGSSILYGPPVQSISDLRAVDVSGVPDKQLRLVEDAHKIYSYDLQSTATPDNEYIVAPLTGSGRWIATNPNILDGGTI